MHPELMLAQANFYELQTKKNQELRTTEAKLFRILFALFCCAIIFNFSCLVITHAMVTKSQPDVQLVEANPVTAAAYKFQMIQAPTIIASIIAGLKIVFMNVVVWGLMSAFYYNMSRKITSKWELTYLASIVIFLFAVCFCNFGNDFGFWLGKVLA